MQVCCKFLAWAAFRYAVIMVRLMHRPEIRANSPAEWTFVDNPFVQGLADLIDVPMP